MYNNQEYWENRYQHQQFTFDWLENYDSLKPYITKILIELQIPPTQLKVLNVGSGNSELSELLYSELEIKSITNIDFSQNVIKFMSDRTQKYPEMTWRTMNATNLEFPEETFDFIIDKCTTDTICCGDHCLTDIALYYKEVHRVLKKGGIFFVVSHSNEETRLHNFNVDYLSFNVKTEKISVNFDTEGFGLNLSKENYIYIGIKKDNSFDERKFQEYLTRLKEKENELTIE